MNSFVQFFLSTPEGVFSTISLLGAGATFYVKSYVSSRFAKHEATEVEQYNKIEQKVIVADARYEAISTEVGDIKQDIRELRGDVKDIGSDIKELIKSQQEGE